MSFYPGVPGVPGHALGRLQRVDRPVPGGLSTVDARRDGERVVAAFGAVAAELDRLAAGLRAGYTLSLHDALPI